MPELRFKINGTEVSNPKDWQNTEESLVRVDDFAEGIVREWKLPASFQRDGYSLIRTDFLGSGVCSLLPVTIESRCNRLLPWSIEHEGYIFQSSCKFSLNRCEVRAQIEDNSVAARIINNQQLEIAINTPTTKNGTVITPIGAYSFGLFDTSTGAIAYQCAAWQVHDALNALIKFMSDDTVDFESLVLDTGADYGDYYITTGLAIRLQNTAATFTSDEVPIISFGDLMSELKKKFNIAFWVDESGATPKLKVEKRADSLDSTSVLTLQNVPNVEESIKEDLLYSKVKIGSDETKDDEGCTFSFPDGQFVTHKEESYAILGECNIDKTLDLVSEWVIDSNVIEDILVNGVDDYDDQIFLIQGATGLASAEPHDITGSGPFVYNWSLTNENVLPRHLGAIPNTLAQFLGFDDLTFEAQVSPAFAGGLGCIAVSQGAFNLTNEISDPSDSYDGTNVYTAKLTGDYDFELSFDLTLLTICTGGQFDFFAVLKHYDKCGTLIATYQNGVVGAIIGANNATVTQTITMFPGEYVQVELAQQSTFGSGGSNTWQMETTSYFQCTDAPSTTYETYDPGDYKVILDKFEYPITRSQWNSIKSNPTQAITINIGTDPTDNIVGNPFDLSYNYASGKLKGSIIRNR